jgi:hypothetical protein
VIEIVKNVRTRAHSFLIRLLNAEILSDNARGEATVDLTFTMNPEQRTGGLPFRENASLKEPCCSSLMMGIASNVVIGGRIWWR